MNFFRIKNSVLSYLKDFFKNIYAQQAFVIIFSALIILIVVITPFYFFLNSRTYDLFMRSVKKPIAEDDSLLLIDIDDNTMERLQYSWPFPRKLHGDAIEVLADFGAKAAIFDIEFLQKSPAGVNSEEIDDAKNELGNKLQSIMDYFVQGTTAVSKNNMLQNDPSPLWNDFNRQLSEYYRDIDANFQNIALDNDQYLATRLHYFGKAYGTVNMLYDPNPSDDTKNNKELLEKYGFKKEELLKGKKSHPSIINVNIAEFPNSTILDQFVNVGFTKIVKDPDGSKRRIRLFMEKDGYIIPQLAFRPFLDIYNIKAEQIDLSSRNHVVIKDVTIGDKKVTIKIPLNKHMMTINWPSGDFPKIFAFNKKQVKENNAMPQHFSFYNLLNYKNVILKEFEGALQKNFSQYGDDSDENRFYQEYINYKKEKKRLIQNEILTDQLREDMNKYFEDYLTRLKNFVREENIQKKEQEIDKIIRTKQFGNMTKKDWLNIKKDIRLIMEDTSKNIDILNKSREELKTLEGKICFIGHTATGTTDLSPTPFDTDFENVGTHPSVFNTILQRDFIKIIPTWLIFIVSIIIFAFIVWILIRRKEAMLIASIGILSTFVTIALITIIYRFTNIYISPVIPFLFGIISFTIMIALKFVLVEQEKNFIRTAFNKYLSPDYIDELLQDTSKLELTGKRSFCTAIFTDVQGFSSISEKFKEDPKALISLLTKYLSAMSDIILENGGTIDKYEGDAIIGFFGEPIQFEDHALKACISSLRMKQIEDNLNKEILAEKIIDKPLLTRIGINTGEMFVGNMGTTNKFNYTMMGHTVNLAARLEGVNKQYGTYQLISENTHKYVKDDIVTRKLDRVRVVNIKTPIRLYELICLQEDLTPEIRELLSTFSKALDKFENNKWKEALSLFKEVQKINPEDGPSKIYTARCHKFLKKAPPENWDGVYNLTEK